MPLLSAIKCAFNINIPEMAKPKKAEVPAPKYINNGTYGCVLRPAVPCKASSKAADINTVSKVFKTSSAALEEDDMNRRVVSALDPEGLFTVKRLDGCQVTASRLPIQEVHKCRNFDAQEMHRREHPQILYEYGGYDLKDAARLFPFQDIFLGMWRIFAGLKSLEDRRYMHMDIKPPNIVYNPDTGKASLIDFGLATRFESVYTRQNNSILSYRYPYYPPEFKACYIHLNSATRPPLHPLALQKVASTITENFVFLQSFALNRISIYKAHPLITSSWRKLDDINKRIADAKALYNRSAPSSQTPFDIFCYRHANRADVYGVGASIAEVMGTCCRNGTLTVAHAAAAPRFYAAVIDLIHDMLLTDPTARLTPAQAYERYMAVSSMIKKPSPPSPPKPQPPAPAPKPPKSPKKNDCPPGKVRNPKTGRCINERPADPKAPKECPPGKVRNPKTGRCIKERPAEPKQKPCPPGKVRNPLTGRCVKAPAPSKPAPPKPCPKGKVRNPLTGRCIKAKST